MKNKKLTLSGDEAGIFNALETIKSADKAAEKTWKTGCWLVFLSLMGGLASMVGLDPASPVIMPALALCGVVLVVGIVQVTRGRSGDIEDERYELAMKLHKFLSHDCEKDTQYEYHLDLRSYHDSSFYLRKEKFGGMFMLPRGSISYYQMPLLTARFKLRDGTAVAVQVDRATACKTVTKRGYSGKVKTKTKNKFRDIYQIKVKAPEGAPPLPERIQLTNFAQDPSYKAQGSKASVVLVQKGASGGGPDPALLLKLLCLLFYSIHYHRQSAA